MHKYLGPLSMFNEHKNDPTYAVEVFIKDLETLSFTVVESWGTPPNRTANIFRYGGTFPPGESVELVVPKNLVPRIVAALSDPQVRADFLSSLGGEKSAAVGTGEAQ